jgi:hypothetical protein
LIFIEKSQLDNETISTTNPQSLHDEISQQLVNFGGLLEFRNPYLTNNPFLILPSANFDLECVENDPELKNSLVSHRILAANRRNNRPKHENSGFLLFVKSLLLTQNRLETSNNANSIDFGGDYIVTNFASHQFIKDFLIKLKNSTTYEKAINLFFKYLNDIHTSGKYGTYFRVLLLPTMEEDPRVSRKLIEIYKRQKPRLFTKDTIDPDNYPAHLHKAFLDGIQTIIQQQSPYNYFLYQLQGKEGEMVDPHFVELMQDFSRTIDL